MLENSETFECYAIIDCCYFQLNEIYKELSKPKNGIDIMIDEATGYGKAQTKKMKEDSISLLEQIIENKKKIEAPFDNDLEMLEKIKEL